MMGEEFMNYYRRFHERFKPFVEAARKAR